MNRRNGSGTRPGAVMLTIVISSLVAILISMPATAVALDRPIGQAIQFGIGSDFTLFHFTGTAISYLHYKEHDRAWRTGMTLNLAYDAGDFRKDMWNGQQGADVSHDRSSWNNSGSAVFECLWYRGERISTFWGGGPRLSFSSSHSESWEYDFYHDAWETTKIDDWKLGAGMEGCLGVQWAVTRWLAVHAEYAAQLMYQHQVNKRDYQRLFSGQFNKETAVTNGVSLSSLGVRFGLSAYF